MKAPRSRRRRRRRRQRRRGRREAKGPARCLSFSLFLLLSFSLPPEFGQRVTFTAARAAFARQLRSLSVTAARNFSFGIISSSFSRMSHIYIHTHTCGCTRECLITLPHDSPSFRFLTETPLVRVYTRRARGELLQNNSFKCLRLSYVRLDRVAAAFCAPML